MTESSAKLDPAKLKMAREFKHTRPLTALSLIHI